LSENYQFKDISVSSVSTKFETQDWILYVSKLPTHSELQIITLTPKKVVMKELDYTLWQNNMYIAIIILAEIVCFLLYKSALITEAEATYSTFLDES
jgi:hypothetical protein